MQRVFCASAVGPEQAGCAVDPGGVAQGGQGKFRALAGVEHEPVEVGRNAVQQLLPRCGDAPAQHDPLRVDHAADIGEKFAHIGKRAVQHLRRHSVALGGAGEDILAGQGFEAAQQGRGVCCGQGLLRGAADARGAGVLLHAPPLAARCV